MDTHGVGVCTLALDWLTCALKYGREVGTSGESNVFSLLRTF
jgi:hypothetical protein